MSQEYEQQKIMQVDLEREMKKSYIDYAMSVIVGRALPDVRDGLKPVHRRILYAMYEDGLTSDKPYRKSATTVGNVLGRYHPHGDASVYDAMVRMAQPCSLHEPLIDGHGHFGSVDGDPPAAYRYTEARMARLANYMLADIKKNTVDFQPNFDEERQEPVVLPSRFPNLLVNGSSGIAVGMATNIPPHNLSEVIDGTCYVIDHPEAELDEICQFIKGPDFPTGGVIMGRSGIRAAYATGRGKIKVRAKTEIVDLPNGKSQIVITEIPYMVNKARLVESMANLVKDKRVEGITNIQDHSSREGMQIVVDVRRDANAQVILNQLFTYSQLEDTISMIHIALVPGAGGKLQPRVLTLRQILDQYIGFQKDVVERRTRFDLKKARDRAHILEGLKVATDNIDRIIAIIRASKNEAEAKENLMAEPFWIDQIALLGIVDGSEHFEFHLDEPQAQAIVDMRLGRLSGLEQEKINDEYKDLESRIAGFEEILSCDANILAVVKQELQEIKQKYGDERHTQIENVADEIDIEDLIEQQDCAYTLTHFGYIKRQPTSVYRAQRRGGRGISAMSTREEDFAKDIFTASTHDTILFFSDRGKVYKLKGYQIPEAGRTAKGTNLVNILPFEPGEKVTAGITVHEFDEDYLVFVTRSGTVKRLELASLNTARKAGIRALTLSEGDELIAVMKTDGKQDILLASANGMVICFNENDVRIMGRDAAGVRGMMLDAGDYVVGAGIAAKGKQLLSVTEYGYGKRTEIEAYLRLGEDGQRRPQNRGGKGLKGYNITAKTGRIAGVAIVDDADDIMLIENGGVLIRMAAADINIYGRDTQGVILMRLEAGSRVISVDRVDREPEEPAENQNPEPEISTPDGNDFV